MSSLLRTKSHLPFKVGLDAGLVDIGSRHSSLSISAISSSPAPPFSLRFKSPTMSPRVTSSRSMKSIGHVSGLAVSNSLISSSCTTLSLHNRSDAAMAMSSPSSSAPSTRPLAQLIAAAASIGRTCRAVALFVRRTFTASPNKKTVTEAATVFAEADLAAKQDGPLPQPEFAPPRAKSPSWSVAKALPALLTREDTPAVRTLSSLDL
mmetsp:Transcript_12266/g.28886  ORF Transcript_12266/g.28886 Transcript_12266/m.28886 type:complete len:207 (+) Transcript_12266:460-1080(+)